MIQLLLRLLAFGASLLLLKYGIWFYLHTNRTPASYRHEGVMKRELLLKPMEQQVNTVFVGSSRTELSIDPAQFDSLMGQRTRSFNMGLLGLLAPNTFTECRRTLQMEKLPLKYMFVELSGVADSYFHDPLDNEDPFQGLNFQTRFILQNLKPGNRLGKKLLPIYNSFIFCLFSYDKVIREITNPITKVSAWNGDTLVASGFRYFIKQPKAKSLRTYRTLESSQQQIDTRVYLQEVQELVRECERKGVQVYFFKPNIMPDEEKQLVEHVFASIPQKNKLELPDCSHWTEDDSPYISADGLHLNKKGAEVYTSLFADSYDKVCADHR